MPKIKPDKQSPLPSLDYEQTLWEAGYRHIAGIDEAGRGALAGPVAAGAVILPCQTYLLEMLYGVRELETIDCEGAAGLA